MSIIDAGWVIKNTRIRAGLTQEELADGVCSNVALSLIETGKQGVSPSTFSALMGKMGQKCEAYPIFKSKDSFDCYSSLKYARDRIGEHDLINGYAKLLAVVNNEYAHNRFYYQETILLYCWLQYRTYRADLHELSTLLNSALKVTNQAVEARETVGLYYSKVDFEILILLANISISLNDTDKAKSILLRIEDYLNKQTMPTQDRLYIEGLLGYTYAELYYYLKEYKKAKARVNDARNSLAEAYCAFFNPELAALSVLLDLALSPDEPLSADNQSIILALEFKYPYLAERIARMISADFMPCLDTMSFHQIDFSKSITFEDEMFDIMGRDVVTLGTLIRLVRVEQGLSMNTLCAGICSVSQLSKIENNYACPSVYTAEALLTRLGISERIFSFYGNKEESTFQELKTACMIQMRRYNSNKDIQETIETFRRLSDASPNHLLKQQYLLFAAQACPDINIAKELNSQALALTIPSFSYEKIRNYRLSWAESCLLHFAVRCEIKTQTDTTSMVKKIRHILDYYESTPMDCIMFYHTIAGIENRYIQSLYQHQQYYLVQYHINDVISSRIAENAESLFTPISCYALSLVELNDIERAKHYGNICIGLRIICGNIAGAKLFRALMKEKYNIDL